MKNHLPFESGIEKYKNNENKLKFCLNIQECLKGTSIAFITVPTPSKKDGSFSNNFIFDVLDEISFFLKKNNLKKPYIININSTVSPGSFQDEFIPFMENRELKNNDDFAFIYNPYFVALGDVIKGLENPDMVLIGCENFYARQKILDLYKTIYDFEKYTLLNFGEAELTKLLVNSFLTLKSHFQI